MTQDPPTAPLESPVGQRIRRCSLHALSEILLITVGILVAVQLNNCNDDRKQQNLEASS